MIWTKEKPMLPGWYWTDYDGIIAVVDVDTDGDFYDYHNGKVNTRYCKCRWSERIEPPFEPPVIEDGIVDKLTET